MIIHVLLVQPHLDGEMRNKQYKQEIKERRYILRAETRENNQKTKSKTE